MNREVDVQNHSSQYYAARYRRWGLEYHRRVIQWLTEGLSGYILDAGCGIGIVHSLHPEKQFLGIDLSPAMLDHHPFPWGSAKQLMDVTHMEAFADASFDGVLCRSLLHHLPDYEQGLREMARVLKPQGHIAFWETNASWLAQMVRTFTQHGDRFSAYHHSFRDRELLHVIQQHFTILEVAYQGFVCYPLFGFPDILPVDKFLPCKPVLFPLTWKLDHLLGVTPCLKRLSFAIGIKAVKR